MYRNLIKVFEYLITSGLREGLTFGAVCYAIVTYFVCTGFRGATLVNLYSIADTLGVSNRLDATLVWEGRR